MIAFILGTRSEIIKMYSPIRYCIENHINHIVISTDQHYDHNMHDIYFEEFGLPQPHYQLGAGSGSHATMLAKMLVAIEAVLIKEKPSVVAVLGDTNSVLAGALAACKMGIKVAHLEAGLRDYDKNMPEEYNRVLTDHCSDILFPPTEKQAITLRSEAIPTDAIHVTGNTIIDAVQDMGAQAHFSHKGKYVLLTCHRQYNTDDPARLKEILSGVQTICQRENLQAVFPLHPKLRAKLDLIRQFDRIQPRNPLSYTEMLGAIKNSEFVITDGGGVQEECCCLQKKCLVLRTVTDRPEVLEVGGAIVLDAITSQDIVEKFSTLKDRQVKWYNPFGDGKAGKRIVELLVQATSS